MQLPEHLQRGFHILAPRDTHWRPATCAEVECDRYVYGFDVRIDESDLLPMGGAERAAWIRTQAKLPGGKRYTEEWREPNGITVFKFPPGLIAWGAEHEDHRVRIDRPELFVASHINDSGRRVVQRHDGAEAGAVNWVDQFATHQDELASEHAKGA
jgi:hypothetical protein